MQPTTADTKHTNNTSEAETITLSVEPTGAVAQIRVCSTCGSEEMARVCKRLLDPSVFAGHLFIVDLRESAAHDVALLKRVCHVAEARRQEFGEHRIAVLVRDDRNETEIRERLHDLGGRLQFQVFADPMLALKWMEARGVTAAESDAQALITLDDALDRLGDALTHAFPAGTSIEEFRVSEALLSELHQAVRSCVTAMREAGAPPESAVALIALRVEEASATLPVHPAIASAVEQWAAA